MNTAPLDNFRTAIDANRPALCAALGLRPDGGRWFCPTCQSDGLNHSTGDLSVEAGFKCHKCGWKGDGFDLVRSVRACDFPAAVEFARGVYGMAAAGPVAVQNVPAQRKTGKVHPTADGAAGACLWGLEQQTGTAWKEARRDFYNDARGQVVAAVLRFDRADGATDENGKAIKQFRPVHAVPGGWKTGDPAGLWPLFRLPEILNSTGPVFVCEGEKAARAGAEIGLTCTASAHGSQAAKKTDWRPLAGREVIILPDNDKAGGDYAETVAGLLGPLGSKVKILELPDLPTKGDIFDFVAIHADRGPEEIREEILRLAGDAREWKAPAPVEDAPTAGPDPIAAAKAGAPFALTDLGNAERLVAYFGNDLCFDTARNSWRAWDGKRWAVDKCLAVQRMASDTARRIRKEAIAIPPAREKGDDLGMKVFEWAVRSESRDRLAACVDLAKSRQGIAVGPDVFDADPWVLNVLNGTLDLRTGNLKPHVKSNRLTKLADVEYLAGHKDSRWERFLHDATGGDSELCAFLQVAVGYTLTGETSEEKLFMVYGPTAGGKSTFLEAMRGILGDYGRTVQADLLARQRDPRSGAAASPDLAGLAGARLAAGSEMEQGREIAEALAKNLTGGEPITARHLYAENFDFRPQFKLWLAVNHCPKVSADDDAVWRRILRVGFDHTVPAERRDKTLKPYLRDPKGGAPAVLAWAVEGCLRWQREGLTIPGAVTRSTATYRNESDPLANFIEDRLTIAPGPWTTWAAIWAAYLEHAEDEGIKFTVAPKRLQDRLRTLGCEPERRHQGRGWYGISISEPVANQGAVPPRDACDVICKKYSHEKTIENFRQNTPLSDTAVTEGRQTQGKFNPFFDPCRGAIEI